MTEAGWRESVDPRPMLRLLEGKISPRVLMRFALGCCERVRDLIRDRRSQDALAVLRRTIDGQARDDELERAAEDAQRAVSEAVRAFCVGHLGEAEFERQVRMLRTGPDQFEVMASADPTYLTASAVLSAVKCASDPSNAVAAYRFAAEAMAATARMQEWVGQADLLRQLVPTPPESSAT